MHCLYFRSNDFFPLEPKNPCAVYTPAGCLVPHSAALLNSRPRHHARTGLAPHSSSSVTGDLAEEEGVLAEAGLVPGTALGLDEAHMPVVNHEMVVPYVMIGRPLPAKSFRIVHTPSTQGAAGAGWQLRNIEEKRWLTIILLISSLCCQTNNSM